MQLTCFWDLSSHLRWREGNTGVKMKNMWHTESRSQDAWPWEKHGAVWAAPSRKVKETLLPKRDRGQRSKAPWNQSPTQPLQWMQAQEHKCRFAVPGHQAERPKCPAGRSYYIGWATTKCQRTNGSHGKEEQLGPSLQGRAVLALQRPLISHNQLHPCAGDLQLSGLTASCDGQEELLCYEELSSAAKGKRFGGRLVQHWR